MEMILTGEPLSAVEAEKSGLVARVFPPEEVLPEAIKLGNQQGCYKGQITHRICSTARWYAVPSYRDNGQRSCKPR